MSEQRRPHISFFIGELSHFSMGQLKYMYRIVQTKGMSRYYGAKLAKEYKNLIFNQMTSIKNRGREYEVWKE